ncbi:hypothetical protein EU604_21015 [Escherichia coli]|nr:hypothetical protein [Escherichia coli]
MTAELRNLPHIASMAFNEPLMLEPAYARVFFCALAGQLGISRLTDAVSGDSLTAQEALATLALSGDDDGPRQARSYQVMNGIAVLPVSGTLVSRTRALQPYSGMTGYNGIIARLQQAASDPMVDGILLDMDTPGGMVAGAFDCADIIARVRDIKPVPEKEAIVDNGAHFDGDQSGTVNGVTPPAVQHLTAEVTADSGEYQVLARWDTPKVVKGVSFLLRLTVAADDGSERLVSTARTAETTYRFTQLALGRYTLTVRAVNAWGQQGDPASVSFRIAAPVAPSRIELTPGYFQITATPHLAVYDPTVQFEFWFSETRITDIRQVETTAR